MSASREKNKRKQASAEPASASSKKKGMSKGLKWTLGIVCAILVIAIVTFFAMLTDGFFASNITAAIANGEKLSPAMVNYYYRTAYSSMANQYGDFLSYMIDTSKPLDEQYYDEEAGTTWADALIERGLDSAASTYALYKEALANGHTLTDAEKANIDNTIQMLDLYAGSYGLSSADAFLVSQYGAGCNTKNYREYLEVNTLAGSYAQSVFDGFTYSADELTGEYAANPNNYDTVNYRLYSITASLFDETDDEEALKAQEEAMAKEMAESTQGDEAAFLQAAIDNAAEDNRDTFEDESATLRTASNSSSAVTELADWLYDASRQAGDTTYVEYSNGYYVAFFLSRDTHDYGMPNVRHILVQVADSSDEEAKAAAQAKAEDILAEYKAGEQTEDAFAALATEYTNDSNGDVGGLYENVHPGQMLAEFNDWCYDASRQTGDTGIIQTSYGYHVMYFSGRGDSLRDYLVESALRQADYTAWEDAATADATYELRSIGMKFVSK